MGLKCNEISLLLLAYETHFNKLQCLASSDSIITWNLMMAWW
jgi:hypothetical protein